ncbi:MAG TPA: FKBP-type peptidyl-prolyl cis-trans isomerase [Puia sp.]|nr:FKBP-type peptidyl-prolyl cis-trans isomerase [Puia sp.]
MQPFKKSFVRLFAAGIIILAFTRCNHFKKGEGDMFYKIVENKGGDTIEEGDFTALTYSVRTEEGAVWYDSNDEDGRLAFKFRERPYFKGDLFSALGLLSEGDSAILRINIDSVVTRSGRPRPLTRGKYLIYTIRVNKVIARGGSPDSLYNSRIEAFKTAEIERARLNETAKFDHYLSSKNIKATATASGLNYIVTKQGVGPRPSPGDNVKLDYTVTFLSGKVIETSVAETAKKAGIFNKLYPYGPHSFPVQMSSTLSGFQEALLLFPKGTKVILIIPSRLAYGPNTYKNIQPYTSLLCELEILDITHPNNRITKPNVPCEF